MFEPIRDVFTLRSHETAGAIRQSINMVAVANAVMAGLPEKMGIGVAVSVALEAWMAVVIARRVGIAIERPADRAEQHAQGAYFAPG